MNDFKQNYSLIVQYVVQKSKKDSILHIYVQNKLIHNTVL